MLDTVERVVSPFLSAADAALSNGYSAVLYGSAARGDYVPGHSDINLILVADALSPARLRALGPALLAWQKSKSGPPLLITRAEWNRATDAFPVEIADMRAAYQVLRGADPVEGLVVSPRRPPPGTRNRVPRQAAPAAAGIRRLGRRPGGARCARPSQRRDHAGAASRAAHPSRPHRSQRSTPARRGGRRGARRGERAAPACRSSPW